MAKAAIDTNHTGQIGITWLRWIIEGLWGCGVEIISAHNDDGIDVICGGQVISDSLIGFFDVDSRSKALGDKLPSFECSLMLL